MISRIFRMKSESCRSPITWTETKTLESPAWVALYREPNVSISSTLTLTYPNSGLHHWDVAQLQSRPSKGCALRHHSRSTDSRHASSSYTDTRVRFMRYYRDTTFDDVDSILREKFSDLKKGISFPSRRGQTNIIVFFVASIRNASIIWSISRLKATFW